jgi:hypothetical protein
VFLFGILLLSLFTPLLKNLLNHMTLDKSIFASINTAIVNKITVWSSCSSQPYISQEVLGLIYSDNYDIVRETVTVSVARTVSHHTYECIFDLSGQCKMLQWT